MELKLLNQRHTALINKILLLLLGGLLSCNLEIENSHFYSKSKDKCITVSRFNRPFEHYEYYITFGENILRKIPKEDFLKVKWSDVYNLGVCWEFEKYEYSISYNKALILEQSINVENIFLKDSSVDDSWSKIDKSKLFQYESYSINSILNGTYEKERQEILQFLLKK